MSLYRRKRLWISNSDIYSIVWSVLSIVGLGMQFIKAYWNGSIVLFETSIYSTGAPVHIISTNQISTNRGDIRLYGQITLVGQFWAHMHKPSIMNSEKLQSAVSIEVYICIDEKEDLLRYWTVWQLKKDLIRFFTVWQLKKTCFISAQSDN